MIPVCATGNEGNASHHYYGSVSETYTPKNVEFLVSEGNRGFTLELWGQAPQLFSVGFRSPGGETIPRIPVSLNQEQRITFVLERTVIYVNYEVVQATTGSQLILIRMLDPTPGIWTLQVYRAFPSPPDFHIWLPITGFSTSDVIISGTGSIHDTDDTFCHGSCSVSLHVSGSKQQFFPGIRPRLYPAW